MRLFKALCHLLIAMVIWAFQSAGGAPLPIAVTLKGVTVAFDMPSIGARFEGQLSLPSGALPLTLKR